MPGSRDPLENDYLPLAPRILKGLRGLAAYLP